MLRREESRHDFAFIAGVIIGAIAGAVTTLALTPMSGNETRDMIRSKVDVDDIKERATSVKEKAAEKAATVKDMAAERASSVAGSAQPMMDKARAKATDLAEKSPLPVGNEDKADGTVTEMTPSRPATS